MEQSLSSHKSPYSRVVPYGSLILVALQFILLVVVAMAVSLPFYRDDDDDYYRYHGRRSVVQYVRPRPVVSFRAVRK